MYAITVVDMSGKQGSIPLQSIVACPQDTTLAMGCIYHLLIFSHVTSKQLLKVIECLRRMSAQSASIVAGLPCRKLLHACVERAFKE